MLEEQLKKGEALKTAAGRHYLDFLDILLTSKVVTILIICYSAHTHTMCLCACVYVHM